MHTALVNLAPLTPNKTYASHANAVKAVVKQYGANHDHPGTASCSYVVAATPEGRFYPVFIGLRALEVGAQFHFPVVN